MGTNTGIGIGIGIPFRNNALGGDNMYFPPELKARMIGVWDNYGKKNTDADRNIIKNKIPNAGGDLEILNSAYRLNSGFGGYSNDFQEYTYHENVVIKTDTNAVFNAGGQLLIPYSSLTKDVPSFKIKVSGLSNTYHFRYYYRDNNGVQHSVNMAKDGNYELPICYNVQNSSNGTDCGFANNGSDIITVEILPAFEGALVTDGINDIIASIKTLEEWNIGDKGITIVSMIHQINTNSNNFITTNNIRTDNKIVGRNTVSNIEKTGIYGWYKKNIQSDTINVINNILGDENDYTSHSSPSTNINSINNSKFYVQGYAVENGFSELSSVAHYWTFAVLGKATEDEINLIIAKYNLDRTLRPDILCNIAKQGITNDNHADFNDKLIDYSGNGRDIQMYNLAWKGSSGVAAKKFETIKDYLIVPDEGLQELTIYNEFSYKVKSIKYANRYWTVQSLNKTDVSYPITIIADKDIIWRNALNYTDENGVKGNIRKETNVPANTPTQVFVLGFNDFDVPDNYTKVNCVAYATRTDITEFTITFIPSCKGGILLDGINDFGKVIDMPIYKDYTFIIDREIISIGNIFGIVASKSESSINITKQGAFLFEYLGAPNNISTWSFYNDNYKVGETDFTKSISYQSKYSYNGIELLAGTAFDSDKLWLGTLRDKDSQFANVAIYSLMSFPYSMSKFLIERQLKKYKLGTLYPNMVEFRPIIKSNVNYQDIIFRNTSTGENLIVGQYYNLESISIYVKPLYYEEVSTIKVNNINGEFNSYDKNTGYYRFDCIVTKSPQKINLTIEQDENYVKFEPVITSNVEYVRLDFYLNNYQKRINIGDYIPKDAYLRANLYLKNNVDELTVFTFNGVNIGYRRSSVDDTVFNIGSIYNYDSPQEVNITIDEYIRYEDIVQPYPVIFQITDRNTNQRYSWGDKIKVGSSIRLSQGEKPNLLSGLYSIKSYEYEGETYSYNQLTNLNIILTKQSISLSCNKTWLLDDNEPKCILSPRLLRIPNSSYKILGYIPDISGHGNNGKINNSAYEGMSGVNGYPVVFGANKTWANESNGYVTNITSNTIHITNVLNAGLALLYSYVKYNGNLQNIKEIPPFKIEIKGLEGRSKFIYKYLATSDATKETNLYLGNGTHELPKSFLPTEALINNAVVGFSISPIEEGVTNFLSDIIIKVLPEYEGAYCIDGVDDSVTIPTTVGGKQVLMKVNWDDVIANAIIYDQRGYPDEFAIYNADKDNSNNPVFAYQARNTGQTYIDGILNSNIKASELKAITHNITITNKLSSGTNNSSPTIGSNKHSDSFFTKMALYDFMLFDDISTDDKIKELNEYVGIEAKVELPPYYWDAYGKTNLDADKATIQQRGTAVGDYDLTNYNHAYDKMSGYGGYKFAKFDNELDWYLVPDNGYIDVVSRNGYSITLRNLSTLKYGWHFQNTTVKEFITKDIPFKVKANKSIRVYWDMHSYKPNGKNFEYTVNNITLNPNEDTFINLRYLTEEKLTELNANKDRMYYLLWFDLSTLAIDEEVTIEMLPLYPNGLAYDGITDYSKNANIPVLTDYTYIYKRTIINIPTNAATLLKGADKTNGGAFIADYGNKWQFNFGQYNTIQGIADGINWQTVNSFNGTSINKGENTDDSGITVAKFSNGYTSMVFYKLILYPKTISLLEINFLKNLMEKDEIIDLNNPIFIKNE